MMFALALVSSYLLFFFISESRHPFRTPDSSVKRKHWRFARRAACIHLIAAVAGISYAQFWSMGFSQGLLVFLAITFIAHGVIFCSRRLGQLRTKSSSRKPSRHHDLSDDVEKLESPAQSNSAPAAPRLHANNKNAVNKPAVQEINRERAMQADEHSVKRDKKVVDLLVEESEHISL